MIFLSQKKGPKENHFGATPSATSFAVMGNASASAATLSSAIGMATFPFAATISSAIMPYAFGTWMGMLVDWFGAGLGMVCHGIGMVCQTWATVFITHGLLFG
ncbi:hypothetical protein U1Q18_037181 [Sarracenia purpurea var. burkii]